MQNRAETKILIIGGGLVGSLFAIFCAKKGYDVEVFEQRPDMRQEQMSAGRSINLAISARGLHALSQVGLEQEALANAIPMRGRMVHNLNGSVVFQPYGLEHQHINSISRGWLNKMLLNEAEKTSCVKIHFNERFTHVDLSNNVLQFSNEKAGTSQKRELHPTREFLVGADGGASVLRTEMTQHSSYKCSQELLDYGYKELTIPAGANGSFLIEKNALHIWPRGNHMLIALPNTDGSFTCTLFLPYKGKMSFEALQTSDQVLHFFKESFPDAVPLMPDLVETFLKNPVGHMGTIKCEPWFYQDKAVLIGDAAHAIVPFFGQGMNCGFEDCEALLSCLTSNNRASAFQSFFEKRKPNADAIADMAVENFLEMRDKVADSKFLLEKSVEKILQSKFPQKYVSRYSLVSFSRVPYRLAYEAGKVQNEILSELCENVLYPDEINLHQAEKLIDIKLSPILKDVLGVENGFRS